MANKNLIKGNYLETATHLIEETILKDNKSLSEGTFNIENKKIIRKNGVKYEIDVYVEIDIGIGTKFIYIFECKNWEKAIDVKEINHFAEKIKIMNAQKGYFIGKKFSKDSTNKCNENSRMEILIANDSPNTFPFYTLTNLKNKETFFQVYQRGCLNKSNLKQKNINPAETKVNYKGKEVFFKEIIEPLIKEVTNEKMKLAPVTDKNITEQHTYEKDFKFNKNELIIKNLDGKDVDIEVMNIKINYDVEILKQKIVFKFDIEKKGKVVETEAEMEQDKKIKLRVVEIYR